MCVCMYVCIHVVLRAESREPKVNRVAHTTKALARPTIHREDAEPETSSGLPSKLCRGVYCAPFFRATGIGIIGVALQFPHLRAARLISSTRGSQ